MNDVAIWAEMLALPVVLGFAAVLVCLLKDHRDFERLHPQTHQRRMD